VKYAVEIGSGAMICIPSFVKIGSDIQKLVGGFTDTAWRWHKPAVGKQTNDNKLSFKFMCSDLDTYLLHSERSLRYLLYT
jgi:hypothetical protein